MFSFAFMRAVFCFLSLLSYTVLGEERTLPINSSLLWGPYRSNLYFGVRPRIPKTLLMGLLWSQGEDYESLNKGLRYACEQSDGIKGYGWRAYDPHKGGVQTIHDDGNQIDLTTEFVKIGDGDEGGNWGVRIRGNPRSSAPNNLKTTIVLNFAIENTHPGIETGVECATLYSRGKVECRGESPELGGFEIHIQDPKQGFSKMSVGTSVIPEERLWDAKTVFLEQIKNDSTRTDIPPSSKILALANTPGEGNMHFIQLVFEGSFSFDVLYSSDSAKNAMTSTALTGGLKDALASFSSHFDSAYRTNHPFSPGAYTEFSQSLLANLLGGMGYFYGDGKVDLSHPPEYEETEAGFWKKAADAHSRGHAVMTSPVELLSSVPSRPFFPRGFLWDEGFHLLLVLDFDINFAMEVVTSWLSLMDEDGWIAREQILGSEARSKVPPEFQTQYPHFANPPTIYLVITTFIDRARGKVPYSGVPSEFVPSHLPAQSDAAKQFVARLYPLLKRHYAWFRRTQAGDMKSYLRPGSSTNEGYRWRGRTPQHTLTSGLDDYPRAVPPHPGELHVDALSWVGAMAGAMRKIAGFVGAIGLEDEETFANHERSIQRSIEELHWSVDEQVYCDATAIESNHVLVCHKGYISLFPFMVGLMGTTNPHIGAVLDLIHNEKELWSPYGLRSLSRSDRFYGTDENYWRGPIWININYLVLEQLLRIAQSPSPYKDQASDIYRDLRRNIVTTVFQSWEATGFAWEQYNSEDGHGQRTQHFTGWTALVVKILAMPDLAPRPSKLGPGDEKQVLSELGWRGDGVIALGVIFVLVVVLKRRIQKMWRWRVGWSEIGDGDVFHLA